MILLLFLVGVTFAVLNRFWVVRNPSFKTHEEAELKVIENLKIQNLKSYPDISFRR